jgi:hypothetical protein
MKKGVRFFSGHARSSALVASLILHAVILVAAVSFVAVKVIVKGEQTFESMRVNRPKMKLRKLTVPVNLRKKNPKPKLRRTIVVKKEVKSIDIKLPEIAGVKGGTGYMDGGGGLGIGFNWEMPDLFGSNKGSGNEFVGYFYDLKQTPDGKLTNIGELVAKAKTRDWGSDPDLIASADLYKEVVRRFLSGWEPNRLKGYFKAPREKFTKSFMIPKIDADEAPRAFGVEKQVKPMKWLALYEGQITAPESGKYRFWGRGDDVLVVRLRKRIVLDASYMNVSGWEGNDPNNRKYDIYGSPDVGGAVLGDWFYLDKGKTVSMSVLLGEEPGGNFFSQLYIQQEGADYPTRRETYTDKDTGAQEVLDRPIVPIFKTAELDGEIVEKMQINGNWCTLEGPNFGVVK